MITYTQLNELLATKYKDKQSLDKLPGITQNIHDPQPVNNSEHRALKSYTHLEYREINNNLRRDKDGGNFIPHLDSAINKHTTKEHAHVWRMIHAERDPLVKANRGDTVHDKGYISTSFDGNNHFINGIKPEDHHLVKITVPKGSKAIAVNQQGLSDYHKEHELLLPRNSKFKYKRKEIKDGITIHHLRHIPGE